MKKEYLQHIAGLSAFFTWLHQRNLNVSFESQIIYLPETLSKNFAIGVPKRKIFGKNVFLAVPSHELSWAGNIIWKRAVIFPEKRTLFLITKKITDENLSTIPSFAIGFFFDSAEKAQVLAHLKQIEIKAYWTENGTIHVENTPRSRMNMKRWDGVILQPEETDIDITFADIIKQKIDKSNRYENPGYKGDRNDLNRVDKTILAYLDSFLGKKK